jgi:hypothetical protein
MANQELRKKDFHSLPCDRCSWCLINRDALYLARLYTKVHLRQVKDLVVTLAVVRQTVARLAVAGLAVARWAVVRLVFARQVVARLVLARRVVARLAPAAGQSVRLPGI